MPHSVHPADIEQFPSDSGQFPDILQSEQVPLRSALFHSSSQVISSTVIPLNSFSKTALISVKFGFRSSYIGLG